MENDIIFEDYHSCPYAEEIGDDYSENCKCCDRCRKNCADDI